VKLPDAIKMAVEDQDWYSICAIYTALTGLPLEPPQPKETDWANLDIDISPKRAIIEQPPQEPIATYDENGETVRDFFTKAEEVEDSIAETLVENEGDNVGEGEEVCVEAESPLANDPDAASYIATTKSGDGGGLDQSREGQAKRQGIKIPEQRMNRFEDNPEALAHLKGIGPPPKPRPEKKRQATVEVVCSMCGKTVHSAPILATGYSTDPEHNTYKCNKCIISRPATR
jgi:hypothetical protein